MTDSFITPTPRQRLLALAKIVTPYLVLFGIFLMARSIAARDPCGNGCEFLPTLRLVVGTGLAILVALALFFASKGLRVLRSGQVPPPGTWVLFRTRIHTGAWAHLNAISYFIFCAGCVYLLVRLAWFLHADGLTMLLLGLEPCF